ncbi:HAMP domain-containing histidine kinase [Luteolibacter yonseiensis]|uniref:histidine kinase n=1 Tax=Luteolibacter yonseiensis TaxID=1144680 RepID=A0A934V8N7_9BACT|nr:HAMP domain-containing sensor histidine kinase [Luteolibacter yonseiensis]MBK1814313.1 HAMP domain-containing histidine kinase [Luteolibacter yonseiensis]
MKTRFHVSLMTKVLVWLLLHLGILALAFVGFVGWQLGMGLDSLLSGAAGERLRDFGDEAREGVHGLPRDEWRGVIDSLASEKKVVARLLDDWTPSEIPRNVMEKIRTMPPPRGEGHRRPPPPHGRRPPPDHDFPDDFGPPPREDEEMMPREDPPTSFPVSRPIFLARGEKGNGYWAGVQVALRGGPQLLLVRSERLDGEGMFFEFRPWLWGGLAVLALSLAFWAPFVWGITRYIGKLTLAADRIAAGQFQITLPRRGGDELGKLGQAIEVMAGRLDHLISGQKRFLGDAAHELCAPLARLRTGLGILEMKLADVDQRHLSSIEADAQELATLVEEVLAFSRAGNRTPQQKVVSLEPLVREVAAREGGVNPLQISVSPELQVVADPTLLTRAVGNLVRNARIHAGEQARITIEAVERGEFVEVSITDDGPGVSPEELSRLFEPFYRPDVSRSRDTGGSGLGLAIVRTAIQACGGDCAASLPSAGGFRVTFRLRQPTRNA